MLLHPVDPIDARTLCALAAVRTNQTLPNPVKSPPHFNCSSIKTTDFDQTGWQSRIWINKRQRMGNWNSHWYGQLEAPTFGQQKAPNVAYEYLSLSLTNVWWSISSAISISNHFNSHFHFQPYPTIYKRTVILFHFHAHFQPFQLPFPFPTIPNDSQMYSQLTQSL